MDKIIIDNILRPNKSFLEYRDNLIDSYVEDYGMKNKDKIIERMNSTYYLFDSSPVYNFDFIRSNKTKLKNIPIYIKLLVEEIDFRLKGIKISRKFDEELYKEYANVYKTSIEKAQELVDIDITPYSSESINILVNDSYGNDAKEIILKNQQEYVDECRNIGVSAVIDPEMIDYLIEKKERIYTNKLCSLITHSIWGDKITDDALDFDIEFMAEYMPLYLCQEENAFTTNRMCYSDFEGLNHNFVYLPLIENLDYGLLDHILHHENRHVIESDYNTVGLHVTSDNTRYYLLNEIRTERKAIKDSERLKNKILFGRKDVDIDFVQPYMEVAKYTGNLFTENEEFFDYIAFNGNISLLEKSFGKENLMKFEEFLQDTYKLLEITGYDTVFYDRMDMGEKLAQKMKRR